MVRDHLILPVIHNRLRQVLALAKMGILFENDLKLCLALGILSVIVILLNALIQVYLPTRNLPPLVFHWFPIIGSTITYGIDPFKFLFDCQAKVN